MTHNQHFVPQVYLNGFSSDGSLFYFDFKDDVQSNCKVPIETICRRKDLYEFLKKDGSYESPNLIENYLCKYEGLFSENRSKIKQKLDCKLRISDCDFLSDSEREFWVVYTTIQMLRSKDIVLQGVEELLTTMPKLSKEVVKNMILQHCLPIYHEVDKKHALFFYKVMDQLYGMCIDILFSKEGFFITSDNPVAGVVTDARYENQIFADTYYFPITPQLLIRFTADDEEKQNMLIKIDKDETDYINGILGLCASRFIYYDSCLPGVVNSIRKKRLAAMQKNIIG